MSTISPSISSMRWSSRRMPASAIFSYSSTVNRWVAVVAIARTSTRQAVSSNDNARRRARARSAEVRPGRAEAAGGRDAEGDAVGERHLEQDLVREAVLLDQVALVDRRQYRSDDQSGRDRAAPDGG